MSKNEELREKLCYSPKHISEAADAKVIKQADAFA